MIENIENKVWQIKIIGRKDCLWRYTEKSTGHSWNFTPPIFEIDNRQKVAFLKKIKPIGRSSLNRRNNVMEYTYFGELAVDTDLGLRIRFRISKNSPVIRFQYQLEAKSPHMLTKKNGTDNLSYFQLRLDGLHTAKEVRLSEFDESIHSYRLTEYNIPEQYFLHKLAVMGPILVAGNKTHTILVAYEHGSQVPDAFLQYHLLPSRSIELKATKGNYYAGQTITQESPYETIWLQFAAVKGSEELLANHYRSFILKDMTQNLESRKPYIFYNTWNYQQRNKGWNGKDFLDSMNNERLLREIDIAHQMGIEVFVLDTGWYEKTGDWNVSPTRFPDGLRLIKERLNKYHMKLGLWFSPTQAACSSQLLLKNQDCCLTHNGDQETFDEVWGTEKSKRMCIVSKYWKDFADKMIEANKKLGVTYFKWDAIEQCLSNCDNPTHWHGTKDNSPQERADCYAFELVRYMTKIVERVSNAVPDVIVDFDITEARRCVGLSFLSNGKYFLLNNGPYPSSFDQPPEKKRWWGEVFVYPGPARARVCRSPLDYDKWIPSVLFLTHYLPDDPKSSQIINLASLILGQNGIWGDLLNVSEEGIKLFGKVLGLYKQVRDAITIATPIRTGSVGGSPEIYEKISSRRGVVAIFTDAAGHYTYITANPVTNSNWTTDEIKITRLASGHALLEINFPKPGAALAFFGVNK